MPRVSNMAGICAQVPTPGLSCSLERLCFRSSLVWCKNPKNNEFRTKKFPNQEFLYGISSFCTLSENNCFLHVKISCFCIFLAKNGVFNTNRTPRVVYGNPTLRAMHSIHKCVVKSAPHLLALLRNELCFRKLSIYKIIIFAHFTSLARSYTRPVVSPRTLGRRTAFGMFSTTLAVSPLLSATSVPTG